MKDNKEHKQDLPDEEKVQQKEDIKLKRKKERKKGRKEIRIIKTIKQDWTSTGSKYFEAHHRNNKKDKNQQNAKFLSK